MVKRRKKYSIELKEEAVRYVRESGLSLSQVAKKMDVPQSTLHQWMSATGGKDADNPTTFAEKEELQRLRRENDELRMERDFLKKAAAFFARESK